MTLPIRDNERLGWVFPGDTFVDDGDLIQWGIQQPGNISPRRLWDLVQLRMPSTETVEPSQEGGKLLQMVPRSGPGREAVAEELRIQKLKIIETLARGNVKAMAEAAPRDIEVGPIVILNLNDSVHTTVFIKISEDLPRVRLTQIFEWEE